MKQTIWGLDLATKTGWAMIHGDSLIASGVWDSSLKRGDSPGMRYIYFYGHLMALFKARGKPSLIVYEMPHHRGGAATHIAAGLLSHLEAFAAENDIQTTSVHSATLKKFATGSGRAGKGEMIKAALDCKDRFGLRPISAPMAVQDDNEADAICIAAWAKSEFPI